MMYMLLLRRRRKRAQDGRNLEKSIENELKDQSKK